MYRVNNERACSLGGCIAAAIAATAEHAATAAAAVGALPGQPPRGWAGLATYLAASRSSMISESRCSSRRVKLSRSYRLGFP